MKKITKKSNRKITIDDLALMVKKGFDGVGDKISKVEGKFDRKFDAIERGQEEIKLKLDNVAYRFELVDLQKRVEELEKLIKIK